MREAFEQGTTEQSVRIAEIRQENRGGDVSSRDIEWLCDEVDRWRTGYAPELRELKAALDEIERLREALYKLAGFVGPLIDDPDSIVAQQLVSEAWDEATALIGALEGGNG